VPPHFSHATLPLSLDPLSITPQSPRKDSTDKVVLSLHFKGKDQDCERSIQLGSQQTFEALQFCGMEGIQDYLQEVQREKKKKKTTHNLLTPLICFFLVFRYASLFFLVCVDKSDNELITLEVIHHFVEILDRYFGNVLRFRFLFSLAHCWSLFWFVNSLVCLFVI
jgi:hypothetical protein